LIADETATQARLRFDRAEGAEANQPRASESSSAALGKQQAIVCALKGAQEYREHRERAITAAPFRAAGFFRRKPRAALADSLALGWFTAAPSARSPFSKTHSER
jgi:hypothetical protein